MDDDDASKAHPEDRANIVSRIFLWWIVDLLWKGNKTPLNQEDLDPVREDDRAASRTKRLEEIWQSEKISARQHKKKPKLWKAMLNYFTLQEHALVYFLIVVNVIGNAAFTYSIMSLMKAIGSNLEGGTHSPNEYLISILAMFIGAFCERIGNQHSFLILAVLGIRARAALVGLIYKKVLNCSKMTMNAGEVMELVCDDTQRLVTMAERFLPNLVRQSAKLIVFCAWLLYVLGWKFIPGLGVFTIIALFRVCMTNIDIKYRKNASQLAEKRLGYLREVLTIINSVKLNCLEHIYEEKIQRTRWQEIKYKAKRWIILCVSFSFTTCGQYLSTFVIVMVYIYTDPSMLTFDTLFTIMVPSNDIGTIICMLIPISIHFSTDIITGLNRIQRFLERCDALDDPIIELLPCKGDEQSAVDEISEIEKKSLKIPSVCLHGVSCKLRKFDCSSEQMKDVTLLNDISIKISSETLVMITGPVGSGKSSLLSSILHGELQISKGSIKHSGSIAYVSDTPWVFPGTVRENILFGLDYDEKWYTETIKACQLEKDFNRFPDQDSSHIGEHGATLSGGQRTRIALARAVYSRADIYLLDDPFSSLDAKVAENIFQNVFKVLLARRIVFVTTLNLRYLAQADHIVKVTKGIVVAQGTVEEVKEAIPELVIAENKANTIREIEEGEREEIDDDIGEAEQLQEAKEDREIGTVSFKVDAKYFMFGAPAVMLLLMLLVIIAGQGLMVWVDIQVTSLPNLVDEEQIFHLALIIYAVSMIVTILIVILSRVCIFLLPIRANYRIHNKMVACLLQAPSYFYAVNPAGRILNRFSQDINTLDDLLPFNLAYFIQSASPGFVSIALCLFTSVYLIPVCFVVLCICFGTSKFFFSSAMDIKRLMSESGGPLYSHFSNTMEGVRTIRVHNQQQSFTESAYRHIDHQHEAMFAYYTAGRWFGIIMDLVLSIFCLTICLLELYTVRDSSTAVVAAVTIMYAFRSTRSSTGMVRSAVDVHAQMTSAERILTYTEIAPEKGREIKEQPPKEWPQTGIIQFDNVSFRHYKEGPKVLKDLSFKINPSEKIGIVGRTGAGKSSLVSALMRIGDTEGNIIIDDLGIEDLNVLSTRQRISVISQSPVLFKGTIRENLNPTGEHDDSEIWEVLDHVKLGILVGSLPQRLDNECISGGSNFSVGQRQLFHLARVLLKRNKIIIFDEATGKLDTKTAVQIQNVIYGVFKDCTVITISHRMATIQKCDRIMVLHQGSIVEFDKSDVLLKKEKGLFQELTKISNEF